MTKETAIYIPRSALRRSAIALLLILFAVGAYALVPQLERVRTNLAGGIPAQIDASRFQAVFLSGGQVFFGRLRAERDVLLLSDVFYLTSTPSGAEDPGTLVKRGNEIFGPTEPMIIAREQVLFVENLRQDSQVVQAIERFKGGETPATPRPTTPAPRPSPTR